MKIGIDIDDTMADTFDYLMPYIAEFFDVDIIYTDEYKITIEELKNNNIHYDKLICDFDKAKVCKNEKINLFIDDSIANCNKVNELGIETILFSSKGNLTDKTDLYRVNSWKDIYERIKNI